MIGKNSCEASPTVFENQGLSVASGCVGSFAGVPVLSPEDCQCSPGYSPAADTCEPCRQGKYKAPMQLMHQTVPTQVFLNKHDSLCHIGSVQICDHLDQDSTLISAVAVWIELNASQMPLSDRWFSHP